MSVDKTYIPKAAEITRMGTWWTPVAKTWVAWRPRLPASCLGKHKPNFTPGMDTGDYVVVVNCEQVQVTGKKLTGEILPPPLDLPGGLTATSLRDQLQRHPDRVIRSAVWGMLPHNQFGRQLIKKLKCTLAQNTPTKRRSRNRWRWARSRNMAVQYYEGIGRRKEATARVRVMSGSGKFIVNEKPLDELLPPCGRYAGDPGAVANRRRKPRSLDVTVVVKGGGVTGQTSAVQLGVARALVKMNPDLRPTMRKGGFLTRDARIKERKKPGLKRARKAPTYTKR